MVAFAHELGLDVDRFREDLWQRRFAANVDLDVESADLSGVAGTPTFVVNGRRHDGPQDLGSLNEVISAARSHAAAFAERRPFGRVVLHPQE
ncbi:DsbA family protein [Amycolatopsis sp. MEPSY49]|uniref:DsbA family protein n=1 Tax=Amycolatopsis sp. MEPSY49 TaxID=3151600 RepID=UPI003F50E955